MTLCVSVSQKAVLEMPHQLSERYEERYDQLSSGSSEAPRRVTWDSLLPCCASRPENQPEKARMVTVSLFWKRDESQISWQENRKVNLPIGGWDHSARS